MLSFRRIHSRFDDEELRALSMPRRVHYVALPAQPGVHFELGSMERDRNFINLGESERTALRWTRGYTGMGSDGMGNPVGTTAPNADLERHRLDLGVCYAVSRRHLEFERREDFSPYAPNAPPPGTLAASMAGGVDGAGRGNRRRRRTISRFASFAPHARDPALRAGDDWRYDDASDPFQRTNPMRSNAPGAAEVSDLFEQACKKVDVSFGAATLSMLGGKGGKKKGGAGAAGNGKGAKAKAAAAAAKAKAKAKAGSDSDYSGSDDDDDDGGGGTAGAAATRSGGGGGGGGSDSDGSLDADGNPTKPKQQDVEGGYDREFRLEHARSGVALVAPPGSLDREMRPALGVRLLDPGGARVAALRPLPAGLVDVGPCVALRPGFAPFYKAIAVLMSHSSALHPRLDSDRVTVLWHPGDPRGGHGSHRWEAVAVIPPENLAHPAAQAAIAARGRSGGALLAAGQASKAAAKGRRPRPGDPQGQQQQGQQGKQGQGQGEGQDDGGGGDGTVCVAFREFSGLLRVVAPREAPECVEVHAFVSSLRPALPGARVVVSLWLHARRRQGDAEVAAAEASKRRAAYWRGYERVGGYRGLVVRQGQQVVLDCTGVGLARREAETRRAQRVLKEREWARQRRVARAARAAKLAEQAAALPPGNAKDRANVAAAEAAAAAADGGSTGADGSSATSGGVGTGGTASDRRRREAAERAARESTAAAARQPSSNVFGCSVRATAKPPSPTEAERGLAAAAAAAEASPSPSPSRKKKTKPPRQTTEDRQRLHQAELAEQAQAEALRAHGEEWREWQQPQGAGAEGEIVWRWHGMMLNAELLVDIPSEVGGGSGAGGSGAGGSGAQAGGEGDGRPAVAMHRVVLPLLAPAQEGDEEGGTGPGDPAAAARARAKKKSAVAGAPKQKMRFDRKTGQMVAVKAAHEVGVDEEEEAVPVVVWREHQFELNIPVQLGYS